MTKTRAGKAGWQMGLAIIEMVNLFYQNKSALHYYKALTVALNDEYHRRKLDE